MIMITLRRKTLRYHLQLKQRLDIFHHLATLDDYRWLLERFLGFYGPVEAALEKHFDRRVGVFDFERRRKVPMLVSDLRALGIKELGALPRCAALPALDSPSQAFGCLYALEIATLGGQIIARHLNRALGVKPGAGCSFFNSYGNQSVAMWHDFGQQIKNHAVTGEVEEAMTRAAIDTFVRLEQWMTGRSAAERPPSGLKLVAGRMSA
ncbi:MAG: biliverdin-producing heme oxygenase [Blastocatellales bacterium]